MREAIARDIEDQEVLIPDGFEEFYDKNSGIKYALCQAETDSCLFI